MQKNKIIIIGICILIIAIFVVEYLSMSARDRSKAIDTIDIIFFLWTAFPYFIMGLVFIVNGIRASYPAVVTEFKVISVVSVSGIGILLHKPDPFLFLFIPLYQIIFFVVLEAICGRKK